MKMNGTISSVLASLAILSVPFLVAARPIDVQNADALRRSAESFELRPGVIVDPIRGIVYLMSPDNGIEALSLSSGDLLWSTQDAAKPLSLYGDLLVAQAESADAEGRLEIVLLDTSRRGQRRMAFPIDLQPGSWTSVDDGLGRSLSVSVAVRSGAPWVSWESNERYVGGVNLAPGEAPDRKHLGARRLDPQTGAVGALELAAPDAARPALPASAEAWQRAQAGDAAPRVSRIGNLVAAIELRGESRRGRILLKRWDSAGGQPLADVELFRGPRILQLPSADGRHLLVSERAHPGEFDEYEWSIFSLETGEEQVRVSHHRSHARFFVADNMLVYLQPPYAQREGDEWIEEPLTLRGIRLGGASPVWVRPLRDTTFRGPFPP